VNSSRQTVKDRSYSMDRFPEEKHKDSAECDNVEDLIFGIVGLKHGDVESAEDRDAVDGEM